jgi:hypothetical protein
MKTYQTTIDGRRRRVTVPENDVLRRQDAEIFDRTQRLLKRNGRTGGVHVKNRHDALLKSLVRCVTCDCAMAPSHTVKRLADNGGKV